MKTPPPKPCRFTSRMIAAAYPLLTRRERQVFLWLIRGKSDSVIGTILTVAARTVSSHVGHIFAKLEINSRTLAAAEATYRIVLQYLGLLPMPPREDAE